jgi:hypothetical protein
MSREETAALLDELLALANGKQLIDVICEGKEPSPSLTPTK